MKSSINVNLVKTEEIEKQLSALQKKTANRKVKIDFVNTKGNLAEEMVNAAFQLNEIGTALATFIGQTEKVVQNARVSFDDADKESAKFFG